MAITRVTSLKMEYEHKKKEKELFYPIYQLCAEYGMTRKQDFQTTMQPGEFQTDQLFSSVAPCAGRDMASSILGNLWPNGARSVVLERPRYIPEDADTKKFYETATETFVDILDEPEAGLASALDEYMMDHAFFGLCGLERRKTGNLFRPFQHKSLNVKILVVSENSDGFLDTFFIEPDFTVEQVVQMYGLEKVSKRVSEKFKNGQFLEKVRIMQVIKPRSVGPYAFGNQNYPYASIHFEWDTNTILKESGFKTMPVVGARFLKAVGETQGRSPMMFALPAVLRHNLVWELIMLLAEKEAEPPLAVLDNGALGGGVIDTSPRGITVFSPSGLGEQSPIQPLFEKGNVQGLFTVSEELTQTIVKAFYIDRLLDFNNQVKMTLGETQIRDRMRGEGMSSIFKRQEQEMFSPYLNGCAEDLLDMGLLGCVPGSRQEFDLIEAGVEPLYMPASVAKAYAAGRKIFKLRYVSPANRIMRTEELQGLIQTCDIAAAYSKGVSPEFGDSLDPDAIMKRVRELTGSTDRIARVEQIVKDIRESRAQAQQMEMQLRMAEVAADAQMKGAQATSMVQGAMNGRPRG